MFVPLPADLAAALEAAAGRLGGFGALRYCAEVDSTNDIALSLALAGAPHGTSVLADAQRAGRGRRGHEWFSPAEAGLYLSMIVRTQAPADGLPVVTLAAGVAAARAVRALTGLPVELKWPNDLVAGRPWRKLGGVLCETAGTGGRADAVVVGLGVNLRRVALPPDLLERATSIETELGRPIDRAPLVAGVLAEMREMAQWLDAGRREDICAAWRVFGRAGLGGAPVRWSDHGTWRRGRARDLDEDGALLVESMGAMERLVAGEVHWETLGRG